MSIICETFGCTPDVAAQQDYGATMEIIRLRAYERAHSQAQIKASALTPQQVDMLAEVMTWRRELDEQR